jgi:hypothetical protein
MIYDIVENINNAIMNYYTIFFSDYLVNLKKHYLQTKLYYLTM